MIVITTDKTMEFMLHKLRFWTPQPFVYYDKHRVVT